MQVKTKPKGVWGILLSVLWMCGAFTLQAQHLTLSLDRVDLPTFVRAVEGQTAYRFMYGEEVKLEKPISIQVKEVSIETVLSHAFAGQLIETKIEGKHILLRKVAKSKPKHTYTIRGYIIDAQSKELLIGANVIESAHGKGTASNEYGFYSITLPEGQTDLQFSYVTYQPVRQTIALERDVELNIALLPHTQLQEVTIMGSNHQTGIRATGMSAIDVPLSQLKSTPTLLGETDVMKTIQLLPGVQAGTEGTAGIYVRGGGPDENLILLDGVPLYNIDHLFGFFSVFTPEAVKKVGLYKGSFPARFGGRLSSVIDVRTNDGNMQKYHGMIGVGLLSAKFQAEGPIVKDRTSFNISGRRSYLDVLTRPFMNKGEEILYYFYDFNAKINHKINDNHRLYLSLYRGQDQLKVNYKDKWDGSVSTEHNTVNWGNSTVAFRWNFVLSSKLFSNTTLAYTSYELLNKSSGDDSSVGGYSERFYNFDARYKSGINDWTYSIDFDYRPAPSHHLKFGTGYLYHSFKPEVQTTRIKEATINIDTDTIYHTASNAKVYAHEASVYVEDEIRVLPKLSANVGAHASMFRVEGHNNFSLQPRLSLCYRPTEVVALKGSYTQMNQYIHLLSSYSITLPTDLWVPSTKQIKPMVARQYAVGAYHTGVKGWEFSAEAYYKRMQNVLEYEEGASFVGSSSNWEDKVEMGSGRAMGMELMAQKVSGPLTGWVAYTLAKSDRKFSEEGINEGKRFPYKYDRRHRISLSANYAFSPKIDVGVSWEFSTGGTTTISQQKMNVIRPDNGSNWSSPNSDVDYIENRNNYRLPASHHLSLGINFNRKRAVWNVSIYNVYNAMNPTFVYKKSKYDSAKERQRTVLRKVTVLPFIPSVSYTYKF